MKIICLKLSDSEIRAQDWDDYVFNSDNGTIFQTQRFLSYHQKDKFPDHSLVFMKKDRIVALMPATLSLQGGERILSSHSGSSWGGLVWQNPLKYEEALEVSNLITDYAVQNDFTGVEIKLSPLVYQKTPDDSLVFCLLTNGYRYSNRELTSVITFNEAPYQKSVDYSVRKAVNKSIKLGVKVEENSEDWTGFHQLLSQNLAAKGAKPTHTLAELVKLKELFPDKINLWNAYLEGELVGGICNWEVKSGYWLIFYSCYQQEYISHRILNRLFFEFCDYCHRQNSKHLDFGTSSINMNVNEGLIKFKELYTAYGVFRDTLFLNFKEQNVHSQ